MTSSTDTITIRRATAGERDAVDRLARLDSRRLLFGPHLVAETGGRIVAAISLADGRAVADPFYPSAAAALLLRERARHLSGNDRPAGMPALELLRGLLPGAGRRPSVRSS